MKGLSLGLGLTGSGGSPAFDPGDFTNVVLVAGDSNSVGRISGARSSYTPTADVTLYEPTPNTFATYTPGTSSAVQISTVNGFSGTEARFAEMWVAAYPGKKLAFVKIGQDGTTLADNWGPGDALYNSFGSSVTAALAKITTDGGTPRVIGLIFHMSTNDANNVTHAGNFQTNMVSFLDGVRASWQLPADAPIAWVRQKPYNDVPYTATVKTAMDTVAPSYSNLRLIDANDAPVDADGSIHYGRFGHDLLGARAFAAIISKNYTLSEGSAKVMNATFDTDIDYWRNASGSVASYSGGKMALAASTGDINGWTGNLTVGETYIIGFTPTSIGTSDFTMCGGLSTATNLAKTTSAPQQGRTNTFGFIATSSSNGLYIGRTGTAAGASTLDDFTITAATNVGTNLMTNGDFSSSTGWTLSSASITGGALVVSAAGGVNFASRSLGAAMVAGGVYRVTVVVSSYTSGNFAIFFSGDGTLFPTGMGDSAGTLTYIVNANGNYTDVIFQSGGGGYNASVDEISLERLT